MSPDVTRSGSRIPRRTLVAGAAWSVPAIVVGTAAPALASSGPCTLAFSFGPNSCENDNGVFFISICVNATQCAGRPSGLTVTLVSFSGTSVTGAPIYYSFNNGTVTVSLVNGSGSGCSTVYAVPFYNINPRGTVTLNYLLDNTPLTATLSAAKIGACNP